MNQQEEFLNNVSEHSMNIVKEDGVYRHIVFSKNGSSIYRFEVTTWPGYLAFTGDMGDFLFTRLEDMFSFFRNDRKEINPNYWSEKVVAADKNSGIDEFSIEEFRNNVLSSVRSHLDLEDDENIPEEIAEEIEHLLGSEDEIDAICAIRDFRSEKINLSDWWEFRNKRYTYRFIWCCYALVWAIDMYDQAKPNTEGK